MNHVRVLNKLGGMKTPCIPSKYYLVVVLVLFFHSSFFAGTSALSPSQKNSPLFIENKGQLEDAEGNIVPEVQCFTKLEGGYFFVRNTGISMVLIQKTKEVEDEMELGSKEFLNGHRVNVEFLNANVNSRIEYTAGNSGIYNYYNEKNRDGLLNVKAFNGLTVKGIYNNIDVTYSGGANNSIKYDFIILPKGDPRVIRLHYKGADQLEVKENSIKITTSIGEIEEKMPRVYQNIDGKIIDVKCSYKLLDTDIDGTTIGFNVFDYNRDFTLVIDPWTTFVGGGAADIGSGISTSSNGDVVITGQCVSPNFPLSAGPFQNVFGGNSDAFISKFNGTTGALIYSTYFGGIGADYGYDVVTNAAGETYFVGSFASTGMATAGAIQFVLGGNEDIVVAKFSNTGARVWSTYYGGAALEKGTCIGLFSNGDVVVGGYGANTFPTTAGAFQPVFGGGSADELIFRINSTGTSVVWSTYYGGGGNHANGSATLSLEEVADLDVDASDNVVIVGRTTSLTFPTTPGNAQPAMAGNGNATIVKLSGAGARIWATYLGGGGSVYGLGVATNQVGDATVTGIIINAFAGQSVPAFPTTAGAYLTSRASIATAYLTKLDRTNGSMIWSTCYYKGINPIEGYGVTIDKKNDIVYMMTGVYDDALPNITSCSYQQQNASTTVNREDFGISKFDNSTGVPICDTYIGGPGHEDRPGVGGLFVGHPIALGPDNYTLYGTGGVKPGFPVTGGADQTAFGGGSFDAVVFSICGFSCGNNTVAPAFSVSDQTPCRNAPINFTDLSVLCDDDSAKWFWSFPGAVVTSSTLQNPTGISYANNGSYNVKLVVKTPCGTDSITMVNYITASSPLAVITVVDNITCFGLNNGGATVGSFGNGPFGYAWSNGSITSSSTGFSPNTVYTVTVTDNNSCVSTATVSVTEPPLLTANAVLSNSVSCYGGNNGVANAFSNGGTQPYTFSWSNGSNTISASNLQSGNYTVTVTDNYGCVAITLPVSVPEPTQIGVNIIGADALCNSTATGSATSVGNGGVGNYNYVWSNQQVNAHATSLVAGIYSVTITDGNGCTANGNINILEPNAIITNTATVDAHCNQANGSANIIVNGGTPAYNYLWSNGVVSALNNNIAQGVYTVTITDANGCTAIDVVSINNLNGVVAQANVTNNTSCNALCDGTANAVAVGGNGPYNYSWTNGQNTAGANGLCASGYTVTISDADGCNSTASVTITQPSAISGVVNTVDANCFGENSGSASVIANGGTGAYTYLWSNNSPSLQTNNLLQGVYSVTVTDANGCTKEINNIIINEPTQVVANISGAQIVCMGSQAIITAGATGGNPGYNYLWNNNAIAQSITVTVNNQTIYTVTITDSKGCSSVASSSVDVYALPNVNFSADKVSGCGPLCVNFINATPNTNSLTWYFGNNLATSNVSPANYCFTDSGSYNITLRVTDNNGCSNTITQNNYITVHPNPIANFSASPQPATILNPTIYFTDLSTGATAWQWNFGDVTGSASLLQNPSYTYSNTGSYEVLLTVTNEFGCEATVSEIIKIDPDYVIYVPNTFTPNGDSKNDIFIPMGVGVDVENYELLIYNRWGDLIYKITNPRQGWDGTINGTIVQQDVYVWKLNLVDVLNNKHRYVGHVNLLR